MAGNATWGGSGRYDITTNQVFNGGAFTLTIPDKLVVAMAD